MQIEVVIPTWNGEDLLHICLPSVIAAAQKVEGTIRIVDDASSDGTAEFIRRNFPYVAYQRLPEHVGFGQACWAGVTKSPSDIVVLLNNDVLLDEHALKWLVTHHFEARPNLFAVSGHVLAWDRQSLYFARATCTFRKGLFRFAVEDHDQCGRLEAMPTLYAAGGMAAFRREAFIELGGFDRVYEPFYSEDMDLSYRAWKHGWDVLYEPRSVMIHRHSATINRYFDPEYVRLIKTRNYLLFIWKNIDDARWRTQHAAYLAARVVKSMLELDRLWLKAFVDACRLRSRLDPSLVGCARFAARTDRAVFRLINSDGHDGRPMAGWNSCSDD